MATLTNTLGLRTGLGPATPNIGPAPAFIIFHFIFAYGLLSSRTLKQIWGLDHNVSPREDLTKYGDAAVASGKITRRQLEMLRRNESAHANAVENFTLFVAAMAFATFAGVDQKVIGRVAYVYTAARVAYAAAYILIDQPWWSTIRGHFWWTGNVSCFYLLWKAQYALAGH